VAITSAGSTSSPRCCFPDLFELLDFSVTFWRRPRLEIDLEVGLRLFDRGLLLFASVAAFQRDGVLCLTSACGSQNRMSPATASTTLQTNGTLSKRKSRLRGWARSASSRFARQDVDVANVNHVDTRVSRGPSLQRFRSLLASLPSAFFASVAWASTVPSPRAPATSAAFRWPSRRLVGRCFAANPCGDRMARLGRLPASELAHRDQRGLELHRLDRARCRRR
jgi:hypothetical protein